MWCKPICKLSLPRLKPKVTGNDISCTGSDRNKAVYYKDKSIIYFKADEIKEIFTDANKKGDGKLDMDGKNHLNHFTSKLRP